MKLLDGNNRLPRWLKHPWLGFFISVQLMLIGCAQVQPVSNQQHPLIGKIIDTNSRQEIGRVELYEKVEQAQVVYLGERHDNLSHHEAQKEIIAQLIAMGKKPAIGFEVFPVSDTSILMNYVELQPSTVLKENKFDAEGWLRKKLGWGKQREASWSYYGPLLQLARDNQLPVFGIELPVSLRHRITKNSTTNLLAAEKRLLQPTGFINDNYRQLMFEQFKLAHCGWGSPDYLGRLYDNWVARNDNMAATITAMLKEHENQPIVIIVGFGHTKYNMGVFERVANESPGVQQLNLAFRSLRTNKPVSEYFASRLFDGVSYGPEHEYIWFTDAAIPAKGHCGKFLKKARMKSQKTAGDQKSKI